MALKSAVLSLILSVIVVALKGGAYLLTGSVALFSDALESLINVVAAGAAITALWVASRPADDNHPYGHQKAEYFSAVLEGVLIIVASLTIMFSAVQALQHPRPLEALGLGLVVSSVATLLNWSYGRYLVRTGEHLRSPALVADGHHLLSDVVTSVGGNRRGGTGQAHGLACPGPHCGHRGGALRAVGGVQVGAGQPEQPAG